MWWPTSSDNVSQDSTVGVYVLSTIFGAMFYGLTFLQNLQYFDRFRRDSMAMKFLILVLWLFDSTTMALSMQAVYIFAVARRNVPFAAVAVPGSVEAERAFSFAVVFIVQMFFVVRIWSLGRSYWYLPVFMGLIATIALITGLAASVQASSFGVANPSHPASVDGLSAAAAAFQIATDIMINGALYWLCSKCKRESTRGAVRNACVDLVNRGVLSTLLQVLTTITYFASRPKLVWMSFHTASSKVHAMSMLSTLNSRHVMDGVAHDVEIADAQFRYRVELEMKACNLPERPPIIPSIHQLRSQSSWFANNAAKSSECDTDDTKSAVGTTAVSGGPGILSASASMSALSRGPSVHARSTTAVDGERKAFLRCIPTTDKIRPVQETKSPSQGCSEVHNMTDHLPTHAITLGRIPSPSRHFHRPL
ncbi:hypothetical protein BC628DRAFT_685470 [Trametes gibbosa]|nr:hypothetical protein BC628DRAFT_685470 [Trametes gibbosa]